MLRSRNIFSQPYWSVILPLSSWVFLAPIFFRNPLYEMDEESSGFVVNLFFGSSSSILGEFILSSCTLLTVGFLLNKIVNEHNFMVKRSYIASFMSSIIGSLIIWNTGWSQSYLSLVFFLASLLWLLRITAENRAENNLFNAGFLFFVAVTIEPMVIFLIVGMLISVVVLRNLNVRELLVFLSGGVVVSFLIYALCFLLKGEIPAVSDVFPDFLLKYDDSKINASGVYTFSSLLPIVLIGFGSYFVVRRRMSNKSKVRLTIFFVQLLSLSVLGITFYWWGLGNIELCFTLMLFSIMASLNTVILRNRWLILANVTCLLAFVLVSVMTFFSDF